MYKSRITKAEELEAENEELAEELVACLALTLQLSTLIDKLAVSFNIPDDDLVTCNESISRKDLLAKAATVVEPDGLNILDEYLDYLKETNQPLARKIPAFAKQEQKRIDRENQELWRNKNKKDG